MCLFAETRTSNALCHVSVPVFIQTSQRLLHFLLFLVQFLDSTDSISAIAMRVHCSETLRESSRNKTAAPACTASSKQRPIASGEAFASMAADA